MRTFLPLLPFGIQRSHHTKRSSFLAGKKKIPSNCKTIGRQALLSLLAFRRHAVDTTGFSCCTLNWQCHRELISALLCVQKWFGKLKSYFSHEQKQFVKASLLYHWVNGDMCVLPVLVIRVTWFFHLSWKTHWQSRKEMKLQLTNEVFLMSLLPTGSALVIDLAQWLGRLNCPAIQIQSHMSHFRWVRTCIPVWNGHTMYVVLQYFAKFS